MSFIGYDANKAIVSYMTMYGVELPESYRDAIVEALAQGDMFNAMKVTLETLYAVREEGPTSPEALQLCEDLATFFNDKNFSGYGSSGRALAIRDVCIRVRGGGDSVDVNDPERSEKFAPALTLPEDPPE